MKVLLTAKFKVHNPSKRKQSALDTALEQYTYAYQLIHGRWVRIQTEA